MQICKCKKVSATLRLCVKNVIVSIVALAALAANAEIRLSVDETKSALEVPKTLYGIFFEDINWAADGGIYAEMVANRGFDWRTPTPSMWEYDFRGGAEARVTLEWAKPLYPENAQYLRIECCWPENTKGSDSQPPSAT